MTYGTSHLLIGGGGGGIFRGRVKKTYCCIRGGHYMKYKNIGRCVLSTQPDHQKKAPMKTRAENAKNYQPLKHFSSLVSLTHSVFYKIHISEATNDHAPVQYAKYVFFFFFLSSHHDTTPLLRLYHFHKII